MVHSSEMCQCFRGMSTFLISLVSAMSLDGSRSVTDDKTQMQISPSDNIAGHTQRDGELVLFMMKKNAEHYRLSTGDRESQSQEAKEKVKLEQ